MRDFSGCKNYTLESKEELNDIKSVAYVLRHNKTQARIALIANDDENKSFAISFNTPQKDSTGVPHILEHSVLCGSKKYPVKDAMTEAGKGSVNTFMNAFTFSDRTIYPFSTTNDKDFNNLLDIYMDAVFNPRVYEEEKIFMQEGWHYELEKLEDDITINGVVYNEMKGAYSSAGSALCSYLTFSLFPDTQYGVESGGDPECIPDLTYENFLKLHKSLYNPSNARIFMYGDMDFLEKLEYLDREYFSKYDYIENEASIKMQEAFLEPRKIIKEYSISASESTEESAYFSYNVVCSDYTESKINEAIEAINYALCSVYGSRLEKALYSENVCKNVYSDFYTDSCQKVFTIIAEGCNERDADKFVQIVETTMQDIIKEGFDRKTLEAAITSQEFAYREADFGSFPKGIAYAMVTFEEWTYKDRDIFSGLKHDAIYDELRAGVEEGLFEKILKERILENPHKSILVMRPVVDLDKEKDKELKLKLSKYKESLSTKELKALIASTKALKKYQSQEDSKKALASIPTLSLDDISRKASFNKYEVIKKDGYSEIYADLPTNGIAYFSLYFGINNLPERLLYVVSLLRVLLGSVDTDNYTYSEIPNEINIMSGGMSMSFNETRSAISKGEYNISLEIRTKALYKNVDKVMALIYEILFFSHLEDRQRVRECLDQTLIRIKGYYEESGHSAAIWRIASYYNQTFCDLEKLSGIDNYKYLENLSKEFDEKFDELVKDMKEVISLIFAKDNLEVLIGCDKEYKDTVSLRISEFADKLKNAPSLERAARTAPTIKNEAFTMASQVQYAGMGCNYIEEGLNYTGRLSILKNILSNDYLWKTVRVQNGAYGCMCSFTRSGECMLVSYRDPGLIKTIEAFKKAADYIKRFPKDKETVDRYIITTIGGLDTPVSSSVKLYKAYTAYKSGISNEMLQAERDDILSTTPEDIRALSKYIEPLCKNGAYCTVGGEDAIKKEGQLFNIIEALFN